MRPTRQGFLLLMCFCLLHVSSRLQRSAGALG
jgi:hypothetical protein